MNDEFIKRMIYENEKDVAFRSSGYFYRKIQEKYKIFNAKLYSDVYINIINYQIKKYGQSLDFVRDIYLNDTGREKQIKVYNSRRYYLKKGREND